MKQKVALFLREISLLTFFFLKTERQKQT